METSGRASFLILLAGPNGLGLVVGRLVGLQDPRLLLAALYAHSLEGEIPATDRGRVELVALR